jgi:hypothetical protein
MRNVRKWAAALRQPGARLRLVEGPSLGSKANRRQVDLFERVGLLGLHLRSIDLAHDRSFQFKSPFIIKRNFRFILPWVEIKKLKIVALLFVS